MERILILGPCGSGKSTLAKRLGPELRLPVIHLDREYWRPHWQEPAEAEWKDQVDELIARPRWIMDGNYGGTLACRLERADTAIVLDYPRHIFFPRMVRRTLLQLGRHRADMAVGCRERIDPEFWRYTWRYRADQMPRHEKLITTSRVPLIRFTSPAALDKWLGAGLARQDLAGLAPVE